MEAGRSTPLSVLRGCGLVAWLGVIAAVGCDDPRFDASNRTLRVEEDGGFESWQRAGAALAGDRQAQAPEWVRDAAGSLPWQDSSPRLEVHGRRPGTDGLLVGYSGLEADPETALTAARDEAAALVRALVLWEACDDVLNRRSRGLKLGRLEALAAHEVEAALGELEDDVYSEAIDRPYGRVHRAAVRLRLDTESVDRLADTLRREAQRDLARARARQEATVIRAGIAVALTLAVILAYAIGNIVTKGYFTWRLRWLALFVVVVVWAVLVGVPLGVESGVL